MEDTCDLPPLFFFPTMVLWESQEETRIPPMAFISAACFGGKENWNIAEKLEHSLESSGSGY